MRIMIDLDGTICELRKHNQDYSEVKVNPGALAKLNALKDAGHYIILQTARHMKTCDGVQGKVMAKIGKKTLDWLQMNNIPYDEIYFGKPYAEAYIDDLAYTFVDWKSIDHSYFDNKQYNILIPIAGLGSRFTKAGIDIPKPIIEIDGRYMIEWAMDSFDFFKGILNKKIIFVLQKEHDEKFSLGKKLKDLYGSSIELILLDNPTRGQAETCLAAKPFIHNLNPLFIYNCDSYTSSNILEQILKLNPDGALTTFKSSDPRYSYVGLDKYGYVCETAEKKVISEYATTGMYYFKRGCDFVRAAERMIEDGSVHSGEFYVAPLYNTLISSGKKIINVPVKEHEIFGTPEEMKAFSQSVRKKNSI